MRRSSLSQGQRLAIVDGMLAFVGVLVILQLWLLTATMESFLGGDNQIVWPSAVVSLACLGLNLGLLHYLNRWDGDRTKENEGSGVSLSSSEHGTYHS